MTEFVPDSLSFVPDKPDEPPPDPSEGGGTLSFGPFDTGIHTPQWLDRGLAGAGKATEDLVRGAGQDLGLVSRKDVADARERDAPLMKTTAGKVGNIAGNVADMLPALAIPGVNTALGATALGAGLGLLQPSTGTKETILNTGLGALTGGAGQVVGGALARGATNALARRASAAAASKAENAERDLIWTEARKAGYVTPPTATNPNAMNTALESISGKAATRQKGMAINARVTNDGVRMDLGLAPHTPLTKAVLAGIRTKAGKAYQDVKDALTPGFKSDKYYFDDLDDVQRGLPSLEKAYPGVTKQADQDITDAIQTARVAAHDGPNAVEYSKFLRAQAKENFQASFGKNGVPAKRALGLAQTRIATALEDLIQRTLKNGGQGNLSTAWNDARTLIAKSHQAEGALRGGNVSAPRLAQQMRANKLVTGRMGLAAKFADQFEDVAKLPKSGAGVSKLSAALAGFLSLKGVVTKSPNLIAEGLTFGAGPYMSRAAMLSRAGQSLLAKPSYRPSLTGSAALQGARLLGGAGQITKGGQPLLPGTFDNQPEPAMARGGLVGLRLRQLKREQERA